MNGTAVSTLCCNPKGPCEIYFGNMMNAWGEFSNILTLVTYPNRPTASAGRSAPSPPVIWSPPIRRTLSPGLNACLCWWLRWLSKCDGCDGTVYVSSTENCEEGVALYERIISFFDLPKYSDVAGFSISCVLLAYSVYVCCLNYSLSSDENSWLLDTVLYNPNPNPIPFI